MLEQHLRDLSQSPLTFHAFHPIPFLTDGTIYLVCVNKIKPEAKSGYSPYYEFYICKEGEVIGSMTLRIDNCPIIFYVGHLGYDIKETYRGNGYALKACHLIASVAHLHGMTSLIITNHTNNYASRRVCDKLGASFLGVYPIPKYIELYEEGVRENNVYKWDISSLT